MQNAKYDSYKQTHFEVGGRESFVIHPAHPLPGSPWVWRTEFFGAFDSVDMALLNLGWHLAYHKVSDQYGCPKSIDHMNEFRQEAVCKCGLAKKAALFGFSRGGLYAVNFAAQYPDHVSLIYLDAPVLDIRSWPGGKGAGVGSSICWAECMDCYDLTEETAKDFADNPLDKVDKLAAARIPILLIAGDADKVVPYHENGAILDERYRALGGTIVTIVKAGVDHHTHSLDDPAPAAKFIMEQAYFIQAI